MATNGHLSDEKGQVTPLWADTLIELVKNEVGLVITGHFCVDKMQRADAGQPVLDETTDESLLRRACDGVHRYGGKLFFQLSHSGIKGVESVNGAPPKHPEDFTREELDRLVEQFAFAAKKCKEGGTLLIFPEGTTIRVSDLFYNTPARLKFMKKDSAETAAVAGLMQHLALSHPDVSFKFIKDGQESLHTPGDGKLESAVYAALGREFAKTLVPVQGRGGDIEVRGFVTAPVNGRGSRSMQVFFVNGRFIKSQLLTAALEEG